VLGSSWDAANKEQKIAFIKAFRTLLLRFYSSALTEYLANHDEKLDRSTITFQDPGTITTTQITVRSEVQPKSGKPVPVNYLMHKSSNGWKVFDVSVEGVSVITTYKTSFATEIQQGGIDKLIASINERNAKLAAGEVDPALKKTSNSK
jgi:phospholipid transport system substrate-binding protein